MHKWDLEKFTYPWEYIVIDNFLPEKLFKILLCSIVNNDFAFSKSDFNDIKITYEDFYKQEVNDFFKQYINETFITEYFSAYRNYSVLESHFTFQTTLLGDTSPIHCDNEAKILTLVLYTSPETQIGTTLYDVNKKYSKTIDWIPNRAFIFCPLSDLTYHSYKNEISVFRNTLNFNLLSKD